MRSSLELFEYRFFSFLRANLFSKYGIVLGKCDIFDVSSYTKKKKRKNLTSKTEANVIRSVVTKKKFPTKVTFSVEIHMRIGKSLLIG